MSRDLDAAGLTQTAPTAPTQPVGDAPTTIGRYQISKELGRGGMGIVYAAFDPELERNVALKILRSGIAGEAEQRLLREARAMAKLQHPNVITVYEVGSANGRDFIAMELIDGTNLADTELPRAERIRALLAAGHGLAGAHAAGIVHRDFKPANVLRSRAGRVVVTDFGLARSDARIAAASSDVALTAPGSVMGTPAYMAPEQWRGDPVTPATDQFAFCVSLWEAYTGRRPFTGATAELLREQILRTPEQLDVGKLPRRVGKILLRGLALEPADRWPSIEAVVARLEHRKRGWIGLALAAVAAVIAIALVTSRSTPVDDCAPAAIAPELAWNPVRATLVRIAAPNSAAMLARTFERWSGLRNAVCHTTANSAKLACLDRVLARFDALVRTRAIDPTLGDWGTFAQLWSPEVCLLDDPPRMPEHYSEAAIAGLALRAGAQPREQVAASVRAAADRDPCARSYVGFISTTGVDGFADSLSAAQLCGDDQAYAAALMNFTSTRLAQGSEIDLARSLDEVEHAVRHAAQEFLTRQYLKFRAETALDQGQFAEAIGWLDRASGTEPIDFEIARRELRSRALWSRAAPGDHEASLAEVVWIAAHDPRLKPLARAYGATLRWYAGEATHAELVAANEAELERQFAEWPPAVRAIKGTVVDERGAPVAGADVIIASETIADADGLGLALFDPGGYPKLIARATTDASGAFALPSLARVPGHWKVQAQHGRERSLAQPVASNLRITLASTLTIRGRLRAARPPGVWIVTAELVGTSDQVVAPIQADGSFVLANVPRGSAWVTASSSDHGEIVAGPAVRATGDAELVLDTPTTRTITVVVRSETPTPFDRAFVNAGAGAITAATIGELEDRTRAVASSSATANHVLVAHAHAKKGDLVAVFPVPVGAVTICATGAQSDRDDPMFWMKYNANLAAQRVTCTKVADDADIVTIIAPASARVE